MNAPQTPAQFRPIATQTVITGEILPGDLPRALDRCPQARMLSLDCFDTLLWRDTHTPGDVFAALPGISPLQRRWAEAQARRAAGFGHGRQEVTIGEIYAELMPGAGAARRKEAIAAECAAEAAHCFAFAPTVALMRAAKAAGLQVVIVSDSYLDAGQLRALITASAGADVAALIDRYFVSSAHGKPKALGLYGDVLRKLSTPAHQILHIGDNKKADVDGVAPFGVNTLHLKQFSADVERQLRLEASLDAIIHPAQPTAAQPPQTSAIQPHRAALALAEPAATDPARRFGLSVIGPVMAGFDAWLRAEAEALHRTRGGQVHWLFLMRDGHLPMRVHAATAPTDPAHAIEISRFTATAASLTGDGDALDYVLREMGTLPEPLARQLLLPPAEIARLITGRGPQEASLALVEALRKGPVRAQVTQACRAMAKRLVAHVRAAVNPAKGDTLMLVDLGYNGTVQNRIDALLARELGVHVAGRYLLLRGKDKPGLDKVGFIDERHYDPHTLEALCANVAVLEQICTTPMGSVVDYTAEGDPIRRANIVAPAQGQIREAVQDGVLAFAAAHAGATIRAEPGDVLGRWRRGAASTLARVMYLPQAQELAVLAAFEHDVNLGTERKVALFDPAVATRGLRQRGLFYLNGCERMYLPAELSGHGMALKLSLLTNRRFGLPLTFDDFTEGSISLPVIFADTQTGNVAQQTIPARPTHDGFYMAAIPVGDGRFCAGVQLGQLAEWVEVDSIALMALEDFLGEAGDASAEQIPITPEGEGMTEMAPRLWHAGAPDGFLMLRPPERRDGAQLMLALVFRLITPRLLTPGATS